ncbi:hypothetical protein [Sorangium sp. So ce124]|uniref:hypothetical protein n=1 Tax=Sorangium sp. So ce124 TaxID=3133280 RepID=UPI003F5DB8A9
MVTARQQFLERVATRLAAFPDGAVREDLSKMMDMLVSMVIRGAEKGYFRVAQR